MILRLLSRDEVARHFDAGTLSRALPYAADGSVSSPDITTLERDRLEATARVAGSGGSPYVVRLTATLRGDGRLGLRSHCSCPVTYECKHGAALALVLGRTFAPAGSPEPSWQELLDGLLDDLDELAPASHDLPGIGLALTYVPPAQRSSHVAGGPRVRLRPLRPGRRQAWVRSGLEWSDVAGAHVRHTYDRDQLAALRDLAEALGLRGSYGYTISDPAIDDFGPNVVALLRRAQDAGVVLVPSEPLTGVTLLDEPFEAVVDAGSDGDGTTLTVGLTVGLTSGMPPEHRLWRGEELMVWGEPAHSAGVVAGRTLVLGALASRLPQGAVRALRATDPVVVPPGADADAALRRLARLLPLTSRDGSVELPEPVLPRLQLRVAWASSQEAHLSWRWAYADTLLGPDEPHALRDRPAERSLLHRLPHRPDLAPRTVRGVDVLHLALLELPVWRDAPDVDVVELDAPRFREADEAPEIAFTVPEPDGPDEEAAGGGVDWLDLEVTVTVEGEPVPLADVIAALTLEEEHLILPSGLFVRTDRPELARLHEVVRAAAELRERDGDRVRVGTADLGVWAQLADLGVVDEQAAEWVSRARALRDLESLPRPEPTGIVSTLRGYQLDGFHWLAFLWQHRLGGILADDMGLGKTLQVLTLVAHTRRSTDAPFLVVAPTSVVSAWQSEAAHHAPGLRVRTVSASRARRGASIADLAAGADVVVTTYTLLRLESADYADVAWAGLVLDEAQAVKNHQSKAYAAARAVPADVRLVVTGTPFENRLLELWALLSIVAPGLYPRPGAFVEHVVRPVERQGDDAALRRFTRRIKPFVLRRTKEVVAADLPPKQEQVVRVELNARHRRIYDTHLARERQRILGLVDDLDTNRVAVLAALTTLRQLALDPALTDPHHDRVGSAKTDLLVERLAEITAEGHRALVFSTFTGFLRRVRERVEAAGIATAYLDGTTRRRAEVIEEFRAGAAPVFLISLKAGGVGLTLTEADYVFVLDPWWNPAAEAQAVDRAHRIGQDRTVMVYRLVSGDTIEDKVMALKERKAALFAKVVDGEGAGASAITAADIRALFEP
jgi:superfamily II DNA or RNA helicase